AITCCGYSGFPPPFHASSVRAISPSFFSHSAPRCRQPMSTPRCGLQSSARNCPSKPLSRATCPITCIRPYENPHLGVDIGCRHLGALWEKNDGDMARTLLAWNGGGNPEYPQQVMARLGNYRRCDRAEQLRSERLAED